MITEQVITELVEQHIRDTGVFLVEVKIRPGNNISIHVDRQEGITVEECVGISRYIHGVLDRDVEDYALEVSSPGIGAPFRVKQQFEKSVGHEIEVQQPDGVKFRGKLVQVTDAGILMDVKGNQRYVDFKEIKTSKEVISFN